MLTTHWRWITALWIVSAVVGTTWGLLSVPTGHDSYNQYASHAAQYQEQDPNFADKFQSSFKAFVGWIGDLAFDANAWIAAATVLLFFATVLLTIIAWQQNKTTKPQLRAYVSVWPRWISSFNEKYFAEFTLTNVGALLRHIEFAITT